MEQTKQSGLFKPKEKFIEFIGAKGNINFLSKEAIIEGNKLSGLGLENVSFKLTIYEDGTVDFDDIEGQVTSKEKRESLLNIILEKTVVTFRKRTVIKELTFTSIQEVKGEKIPLYLAVEYTTPIEKLASILDEDVEISDKQMNKLDELMSLFDDIIDENIDEFEDDEIKRIQADFDAIDTWTEELDEDDEENSNVLDEFDYNKSLEESFTKMKEEKVEKLKKDLQVSKSNLSKFQKDKNFAESKIAEFNAEVRLIQSRIDSLQPVAPENGYIFNVSQRLNEEIILEKEIYDIIKSKVEKVKSINSENFMKLFEEGEFQIRLSQRIDEELIEVKEYEKLPEEISSSLDDLKLVIREDGLFYVGDMIWAEIVNKMIKLGFVQNTDWDKNCNSSSWK